MTTSDLAKSYLTKASKRLRALEVLFAEDDYSDVIREAQEIVELAEKAVLRALGIDPPKIHDVSQILVDHADDLPREIRPDLDRIVELSKWLRKEREISFYGDIDFIPTEEYRKEDASRALEGARSVVAMAALVIK